MSSWKKIKKRILIYPDAEQAGAIPYYTKGAKLIFVGINPHPGSEARGIPFSNNKLFWYLLSDAGILPESRKVLCDDNFLRKTYNARFGHGTGLGFVNIIDRPTRVVSELKSGEEARGRARLLRIIKKEHPRVVCFIGKITYEKFIGSKNFNFGWQRDIDGSRAYVMHYPQRGTADIRVRDLRIAAKAADIKLDKAA